MALLDNYPKLSDATARLDSFLRKEHPEFFSKDAKRPYLPLKPTKVIHDPVWGTFSFSWRELAVLDTPLIQRLRDIHQVGLAYQVYPSARHSRLEHSLGVLVMASRTFEALTLKHRSQIRDAVKVVFGENEDTRVTEHIERLKQELRLAALLHDCGHSLHSHASERVFGKLGALKEAAEELSDFAGKKKGAGEVLSFCFTMTPCLAEWLKRAAAKLNAKALNGAYAGEIDLQNVALMIIGRSANPLLQFLGDIISSDIDADKLDYLLRDSLSAGLPLRYDVDMYLYSAQIDLDRMEDDEGALEKLYTASGAKNLDKHQPGDGAEYAYYEGYRLCLPKRAMHVLEQIIICKMMLYSYVYHHSKVRAAEGLLERMLDMRVESLTKDGKGDWDILEWFLKASDADLMSMADGGEGEFKATAYRLVNRILPREIFRLTASEASGPPKALLSKFLVATQDKQRGNAVVTQLENAVGEELKKEENFKGLSPAQALFKAGVWIDVPKAPKFEETKKIVSQKTGGAEQASGMFPVEAWQQAYANYRLYVRIYAYSEFVDVAKACAARAMGKVIGIEDGDFYKRAERTRS